MGHGRSREHRQWRVAAAGAGMLLLAGCGATAEQSSSSSAATTSAASSATAATTAGVSASSSDAGGEVTIADSWVKATVGTTDPSMTAAFGVLTNHTDQDLTIVSATNDVTDRTELHEMAMVDGAMVMRPIAGGIPIPANGTTTLEPGGLHVMIMDATTPIAPGERRARHADPQRRLDGAFPRHRQGIRRRQRVLQRRCLRGDGYEHDRHGHGLQHIRRP